MAKLDISIAGEINLDLILYGLPQTMPVERELLASGSVMTLGSSSAILAHNLAVLGTKVGFITKAGDDALANIALERVAEAGVDVSRVVRARGSGSGVTVILPHERQRHILTYPGTISELRFEDLDLEYLASARHFHMSSLFLHRAMWQRVPLLVVKLGDKGAIAIRDQERVTSPPVRVEVVDPVGAGDSFDAGFLHQYLVGSDLASCLAYGNLAGAFSTTQPGGTEAFRDRARQQRFFTEHRVQPGASI